MSEIKKVIKLFIIIKYADRGKFRIKSMKKAKRRKKSEEFKRSTGMGGAIRKDNFSALLYNSALDSFLSKFLKVEQ